jgi:hypothetical protein
MAKPYRLLRIIRVVLLVLAYLAGISNLIFAGLVPLIMGGEPVPLFVDAPPIPVRALALLNIFITAPLSFMLFYVPSGVIHLLLSLREGAPAKPAG